MTIAHVLVPLDWSTPAEQALDYAIKLAGPYQARLTLLHVIQPGVDVRGTLPESYWQAVETEAQEGMAAARAHVTAAGITAETVLMYGVPWQAIVDTAGARHVDLIVLGTHGRTGFKHFLLGSVAERVVRHAPCSVLVVRPDVPAAV